MSRRSRTPRITPTWVPHRVGGGGSYTIGPDSSFGRRVTLVNPEDQRGSKSRFLFAFGQVSALYLMAWGRGFDEAFERACEWLGEHAPGVFSDEVVHDEYERLRAEGKSEEEAREEAEVDTTVTDEGHYLMSDHWAVIAENPSRAELDELLYPSNIVWHERVRCDRGVPWMRCYPRRERGMRDMPLRQSAPCEVMP